MYALPPEINTILNFEFTTQSGVLAISVLVVIIKTLFLFCREGKIGFCLKQQ